ncbi:hypothetical protein MP228_008671 [Amoeboaphelidium protococcarum]|nr:hypothetical protein MP228_008671 [Amoeboaphelidium protococcarum]
MPLSDFKTPFNLVISAFYMIGWFLQVIGYGLANVTGAVGFTLFLSVLVQIMWVGITVQYGSIAQYRLLLISLLIIVTTSDMGAAGSVAALNGFGAGVAGLNLGILPTAFNMIGAGGVIKSMADFVLIFVWGSEPGSVIAEAANGVLPEGIKVAKRPQQEMTAATAETKV